MNPELWSKVEEIFHAALERQAEERQSFLDGACNGNSSLRRQVAQLLSAEGRAGSFLEAPILNDGKIALAAGTVLAGNYRILSPLGAGGMGEVYRAHDGKLGRDVAVKVLPPAFAGDPERLARFRREARTLASLNHPNIAAIYGLVEEPGKADCLVLELVEGEMLRGPLPVSAALDRALQVADALKAAHEKGIIHRDLKPGNVKVTPQGRVKVLDFGLAKAIWGPEVDRDLSQPGAALEVVSLAGQIAGTPGYMSPEQARGKAVDERADIWAFGCLLFELLAGKRAFAGGTLRETISAVLEQEADWHALPAKTPGGIRDLLRQCLQKEAGHRLQDIEGARRAIEHAQRGRNLWRAAAVLAAALGMLAVGAVLWRGKTPAMPDHSQWVQLTRLPDPVSQPALSSDGRMLAFVRSSRTWFASGEVYVKQLPDGEPVQLTHDRLVKMNPAFSPDGKSIAYSVVDSRLHWNTWVVPIGGGEPRHWMSGASDIVWNGPGQVLFSKVKDGIRMGIGAAEGNGEGERSIYLPVHERSGAHLPKPSPDGKWVLLTEVGRHGRWEPCRIVPADGSSTGYQVGPPGVTCTFGTWSPDGKWIYLTSKAGGLFHIWRQRFPNGEPEQFTSGLMEEEGVAMAPDGRSIVTAVGLQSSSVWIHDAKGDRQISMLEGNAAYPRFTADGRKLCYRTPKAVPVFGTDRDPGEVWVADVESGLSEPLAPGFPVFDYDLSPDGKQVVLEAPDAGGTPRIWLAPLDRQSAPRQIPGIEGQNAHFGPDGEIFFRHAGHSRGYIYRVKQDGSGLRKALERPILFLTSVSPDGRWILAWASHAGNTAVQIFPLDGESPVVLGGNVMLQWTGTRDAVWISAGPVPDGRSYMVPLAPGKSLPPVPAGGFRSELEIARLPGARRIDAIGAPGPTRNIYAFEPRTVQRNLYRIPIP